MVNRYMSKVAHLTNAIKAINELIEDIPTKYLTFEYEELVDIFSDVNKKLVARLADLV